MRVQWLGISALAASLALACGNDDDGGAATGGGGGGAGGSGGSSGGAGTGGDTSLPIPPRVELIDFVNPMIGTGGDGFGVGSAYPGPALPFAMIHPGPDTNTKNLDGQAFYHCAGYHYGDALLEAFSLTHMHGTGVPDYGNFGFMPVDGMDESRTSEAGYASSYSDEKAELGYYEVTLEGGRRVQITSTLRAAHFVFHFPQGTDPVVLLDAEHTIGSARIEDGRVRVDGPARSLTSSVRNFGGLSNRIGGFVTQAHAVFDQAPAAVGVWDENGLREVTPTETALAEGIDVGGWFRFPAGTTQVQMRVAISFADEAAQNLAAEMPDFDFEARRAEARSAWQPIFDAYQLFGANDEDSELLATAVYHTWLMPTLMTDVSGSLRRVDDSIGTSDEPRYSDFSLWDTYRTFHPWLMLAERDEQRLFVESMVQMAREGGAVPRWALARGDIKSMIGSPGEIVLAESKLKGVPVPSDAYSIARVAAFGEPPGEMGGRSAIAAYLEHGYVPADMSGGSVSRTLEYATADAALATWAELEGESADAVVLRERAESWRSIYDQEIGFFRAKMSDGSWGGFPGETIQNTDYTEGNPYHYLWMVGHDPTGLAEVMGGEAVARDRLQQFFELSQNEIVLLGVAKYYWHGNEPNILAPWLFAAWGDRSASKAFVQWVVDERYGTGPDGLAGNDDAGTLSTWLLFASVGLYPVSGTDRYIVGAPFVPRVVLERVGGDLTVETTKNPREASEVVRVLLDGEELDGPTLTHAQLLGEHTLRFELE